MDRIIIGISALSRERWRTIYKFIKCVVYEADLIEKETAFKELKATTDGVRWNACLSIEDAKDVYSLYGEDIIDIRALSNETCFSIIFKKKDDKEDFAELVPFVLIQQEFKGLVTLGIDTSDFKNQSYKFKCSEFFILHNEHKPKLGNRSIYFIENNVDKNTGEISCPHVTSLAGKGISDKSEYKGNVSRRFLPLIRITEDVFKFLFGADEVGNSKEFIYVKESITKIKADLKKVDVPEQDKIFSGCLFDQWFVSGYFNSYSKGEIEKLKKDVQGLLATLQVFKDSVQELVQNIIFHGGKNGLLYCVFDKKANISDSYSRDIPNFSVYNENTRFLRIGIFDYNENGIVDTFRYDYNNNDVRITEDKNNARLTDFFDINNIVTTGLNHLDMRYAARLGIKTFVKTIVDYKGYFRVESCEHTDSERVKKSLSTTLAKKGSYLGDEKIIDFTKGTHYEIILPVVASKNFVKSTIPIQTTSVSNKFSQLIKASYPLMAVRLSAEIMKEIDICKDKHEQVTSIERVCKEILEKAGKNQNEIAIDLNNHDVPPNTLFKFAAFLQLKMEHPLEKIIVVNAPNEFIENFCSRINTFLIKPSNSKIPVWSRECAIIIMNDDLHGCIVWGRTKDELCYINKEYKKLYYNHFLDLKKDTKENKNSFNNEDGEINEQHKKMAGRFVLPYDVLIKTMENGENHVAISPFEKFLDQLLKREIVSNDPGLSVNHKYTYIGRKIIVENYYEADTLFQNNFFVNRFAYLIANNIMSEISLDNNKYGEKTIVLIGYKYYSEFLLKAIQDQIRQMTNDKKERKTNILLGICDEGKDFSDNNVTFNFGINSDENKTEEEILDNPNKFVFATIVPIGATLSTNDKIISFFKQWFDKKVKERTPSQDPLTEKKINREPTFIYNHCAIVVRDKIVVSNINEKSVTIPEEEQKWISTNLTKHFIETQYENGKKVYYTILVANRDNPGKSNWIKRLNNSVSFPSDWREEKYVNLTENSSINSQNIMGLPEGSLYEDENEGLEHIFQLKDYIYKGHLEILKCHHKFYIDTESFVREKSTLVKDWLHNIKKGVYINTNSLNVLITPNVERESDFISLVNEVIFDNNALIVYLDVNNWRSNIVNKLSFLKKIHNVSYHYVDHAFLSGETYLKSKSFLYSIVGKKERIFHFAFTILNRLSYNRDKEIREELKTRKVHERGLFAYANLHYPTSKDDEQECELCRLKKYYEDLGKKTVLESCAEVIRKSTEKIKLTTLNEAKKKKEEIGEESKNWQRRIFLRLVITHCLYYRISRVAEQGNSFDSKKKKVNEELNNIYASLCEEPNQDTYLNQIIGQWFVCNTLFEKDKELTLDKRISFLKAISSPPLSKYISIREYAHNKLLDELKKILDKADNCTHEDLKIVKSLLKSLSFLKSNALVRKDVIVGVWRILKYVTDRMNEEKKRKIVQDFSKDIQFFIKNAIVEDEAKATFLGELLRQGKEMVFPANPKTNPTLISPTILSLSKNDSNEKNTLFNEFCDCDDNFKREYTNFLVWLFYDNTTIIRNTLTNFSREIEKNTNIRARFYDGEKLKRITDFKKDIDVTKKLFGIKVKEEYYYSSILPYLENGDNIDYVEKLIYVTYAKLKLEDLTTNKHKTHIESDTRDLMEIFAAIMGADAAFWTMKKNDNIKDPHLYPISIYGNIDFQRPNTWNYDKWDLNEGYYTYCIYTDDKYEEIKTPLISKNCITNKYGEKRDLKAKSIGFYLISNIDPKDYGAEDYTSASNSDKGDGTLIASITFLYKNLGKHKVKDFRIKFQEYGRLLLLLKNEINKYVIGYLIKDRALDLWEEKFWSTRKFDKIYANSAHVFNSVYKEMEEFETIDVSVVKKLSQSWFVLTNETISFFYSNIEKNVSDNESGKHCIKLIRTDTIIDTRNKIGDIFNKTFISILSSLLDSRWKSDNSTVGQNKIFINGKPLLEYCLSKEISNTRMHMNKHLIRTFIAQCINNSLAPETKHGHRGAYEVKNVNIAISESSIVIEDDSQTGYSPKEQKIKKIEKFNNEKEYIKLLKCERYSSTTLTSLQGVINYMQEKKENISCDYGFNTENNNFYVIIKFK